MTGGKTYGLLSGYRLIYNIKATGKIDNANNAKMGILCQNTLVEINVFNATIDVVILGTNKDTTGIVNTADANVLIMGCSVRLESPASSENAALLVGFMRGVNLTQTDNVLQAVLTTTGSQAWFYAAMLCGKILDVLFTFNATNNEIRESKLVTTSRGAMISSYFEGK